jgi:hypothetical protein
VICAIKCAENELEAKCMDETGIDRDTMARLARSLSFIKSPDDPVVTALKQAADVQLHPVAVGNGVEAVDVSAALIRRSGSRPPAP